MILYVIYIYYYNGFKIDIKTMTRFDQLDKVVVYTRARCTLLRLVQCDTLATQLKHEQFPVYFSTTTKQSSILLHWMCIGCVQDDGARRLRGTTLCYKYTSYRAYKLPATVAPTRALQQTEHSNHKHLHEPKTRNQSSYHIYCK